MIVENAKALCGWKGREEISDGVYACMLAHKKIRELTIAPNISPRQSKKIESLQYWTGVASHNITRLKSIRNLYRKAYREGDKLYNLITEYAKTNWERLDELNDNREYYYRRSIDAFNNGSVSDHWNKKIHELDAQIAKIENSK